MPKYLHIFEHSFRVREKLKQLEGVPVRYGTAKNTVRENGTHENTKITYKVR